MQASEIAPGQRFAPPRRPESVAGWSSVVGRCCLAITFAMLFAVPASAADDVCGDGGIGGTGAPVAAHAGEGDGSNPEPVGGIGGTGIVARLAPGERGRVIGTITRFGSICVNRLRIAFEADTPTARDGRAIPAADLQVGQMVRVEVARGGDALRAQSIVLLASLVGTVTARDEEARVFRVMGQPVRLSRSTWIGISGTAVPAVGTKVRVSGVIDPAGIVAASRLDGAGVDEPDAIMARVREIDGRYLAVGEVHVELVSGEPAEPPELGEEVAVAGRWNGEALVAQSLALAPRGAFGVRAASIEGFLHGCRSSDDLGLDGQQLDFGAAPPPRGWVGRRVVADGHLREDGVFEVERVVPSPFDGDTPGKAVELQCTTRSSPGS
ncbi:MAG: hypothetical protein K2Y35_10095 [Burkholderiales bacterium]|nr:hypothetical protein [Burkholderiales bacterium]